MRRIFEITLIMAVLIGCSERYSPTAPLDQNTAAPNRTAHALSGVSGQQVSLTVSDKTVIASTNFAGELSAVAQGCTVSPNLQQAVETPGSGGMKTATFTLSGFSGCCSTRLVTVTDKKNNSATVPVTGGSGSGSDCV
ncbi:MAG TPA: hypothetical protein VJ853_05675 [Thermoanaerobaculia bacterium]|nr:hypothetical protein [Thermoanaerobaculia bacterium]